MAERRRRENSCFLVGRRPVHTSSRAFKNHLLGTKPAWPQANSEFSGLSSCSCQLQLNGTCHEGQEGQEVATRVQCLSKLSSLQHLAKVPSCLSPAKGLYLPDEETLSTGAFCAWPQPSPRGHRDAKKVKASMKSCSPAKRWQVDPNLFITD